MSDSRLDNGPDNSPDNGPDTAPIPRLRTRERRRAAIALVVLAVGAAAFVGILIAALGVGGGSSGAGPKPVPTGPPVTVTGAQHSTLSSSHSSQRTSASQPPTGGTASCPTSAPCALGTDIGDVVGALNTYRTRHGRSPVSGQVTATAKTCAVTSGDQCPTGFYWEPVGRSGTQVIHKIVSTGRDNGQLLDRNLTSVQVGWAYVPQSHSYEVALIVPS